jgi:ATP/maltotriose-dependent transcriptional regulator MalT
MVSTKELAVPYEAARARLLLGLACRSMDDHDSGDLELEAARQVFAELGAVTELAHVDSLIQRTSNAHGLTVRELEVLRLVAAGKSNRRSQRILSSATTPSGDTFRTSSAS